MSKVLENHCEEKKNLFIQQNLEQGHVGFGFLF